MERAAKLVIENKGSSGDFSIRKISKEFNIHYSTLSRFIKKKLSQSDVNKSTSCGYAKPWKVFSDSEETILKQYILKCSDIMFGLAPKEVRHLAYLCAKRYNLKIPPSWEERKIAGIDWFSGFLKRHQDLSIRQPEPTSLARMTSFNKTNVEEFYKKLGEVFSGHPLLPSRIWNFDESGVTTVLKPNKIVAGKGVKQVGTVTSAERGELVTVAAAVSAQGTFIPPMIVFPRKIFKDHFIRGGPAGCIGAATGSGWMIEESFVQFIEHFILHTKPSKDDPVLLLLDNHSSHLSIVALDMCKNNGVILLSFPPHCSHRLQPLDVSVYGPFKKMCSRGIDAWLKTNPGKTLTIYDLPNIIKEALLTSFTPTNITSGLSATGIFPYNASKFQDSDFSPSFVSDRPNPEMCSSGNKETDRDVEVPGPSGLQHSAVGNTFCIEEVRSLPKAEPRKQSNRGKKKRRCAILTDTPEKAELENERQLRVSRQKMKAKKKLRLKRY